VKEVNHLKGGIHKYLEEYGGDDNGDTDDQLSTLWKGRNFVFDGRIAASARETRLGRDGGCSDINLESKQVVSKEAATAGSSTKETSIVGECVACEQPFDEFDPHCVCTVCREPTLVCLACRNGLQEYHCRQHSSLRNCFYSDLSRFTSEDSEALQQQLEELLSILERIKVGRGFKQKRKTITKQCARVRSRLHDLETSRTPQEDVLGNNNGKCRNCGDNGCTGRCWGFFGLKRKELLDRMKADGDGRCSSSELHPVDPMKGAGQRRQQQHQQQMSKKLKRDNLIAEIDSLKLSLPPSAYRDPLSGVRILPCSTRRLRCATKAKWCGRPVVAVLQEEFADLARPDVMQRVLERGLLRVNDKPVESQSASQILLKSSDVLSRIVHWHEPPAYVPEKIEVTKVSLPSSICAEYGVDENALILACNKPATVPVHPCGPYLGNSMTMMVEAQENYLESLSLTPLHRTDRVTSGLTLCCTDPALSRVFHKCSTDHQVKKLYLARVSGKFVDCARDLDNSRSQQALGSCRWIDHSKIVEVDVPIETVDPSAGIRKATVNGKPSKSLFRLIEYNPENGSSLVACCPVTGRNHQLRVHLQWLGFPIVGDIIYGGKGIEYDTENETELTAADMTRYRSIMPASDQLRLPDISDEDVKAATEACPHCCCDRSKDGFTPAQLLQGGHAIYLHALRYEVSVPPKKRSTNSRVLSKLSFSVGLPSWADTVRSECIPWLTTS